MQIIEKTAGSRKILLIALSLAIAVGLLAGCSRTAPGDSAKTADQETARVQTSPKPQTPTDNPPAAKEAPAHKPPQEPQQTATKIAPVPAEAKPNPELEKTIIDHLKIPREYLAKTKYYYNYVDLNSDGADEIFAVVMGPYTSGSGGSTALHIVQNSTGMHVNQTFTLIRTPVIVSDKITNGVKELIVKRSGGGGDNNYVVLTCSDGRFTPVNEGAVIESLEGVSGQAIISNDILKDMEEGKSLYLQPN